MLTRRVLLLKLRLLGRQTLAQSAIISFENKQSVPCDALEDAPRERNPMARVASLALTWKKRTTGQPPKLF